MIRALVVLGAGCLVLGAFRFGSSTQHLAPSTSDTTKFVVHGDHIRPAGIALRDTTALRNPF